jgi:hypothetical protein
MDVIRATSRLVLDGIKQQQQLLLLLPPAFCCVLVDRYIWGSWPRFTCVCMLCLCKGVGKHGVGVRSCQAFLHARRSAVYVCCVYTVWSCVCGGFEQHQMSS